jgi:hypothetical protein
MGFSSPVLFFRMTQELSLNRRGGYVYIDRVAFATVKLSCMCTCKDPHNVIKLIIKYIVLAEIHQPHCSDYTRGRW